MKLGIHLVFFDAAVEMLGKELAGIGAAAESAGAAHLSVMDHYFQMQHVGASEDPMLEGYTTLGYLAAHTSSVRLGVLVTGVTYRYPGLLAKIVTTLDVLSEGRGELGIGAGWYEREHLGLGVPFPPVAERFERLEETLRICLQMWDPAENGPFEGKHYRLAETIGTPLPISRPRPPIMVGGGGERKTLRLVAQYADSCNLFASSVDEVAHKLDVLRRHCDDVGRDYDEISKTVLYNSESVTNGDTDAFLRGVAPYADLGIDTVIVAPPGGHQADWIERTCTPAVPRLAELG